MLGSWGRVPVPQHRLELLYPWRDAPLPEARPLLAHGAGRSYGDACLNDGGALLSMRALDRFIAHEGETLRCEAGVTLREILRLVVPRGYFLHVVPGTQEVTVGGAIANDIHGKNHHRAGSFGAHVTRFELLRSDGRREVRRGDPLFAATVGGLGLTGAITWAELSLRKVPGPAVRVEATRFRGLDEFARLTETDAQFEFTVAWVDVTARDRRGVYFRGDHAEGTVRAPRRAPAVPVSAPLVHPLTVRLFNAAYYAAQRPGAKQLHYEPFFFPLDGVAHWNRLYGARGFYQFQCVVPQLATVSLLLDALGGEGSPLTVLKRFGDKPAEGLMSFPRPGYTLAVDLVNRGAATDALLARLEAIALEAGGALYPAKDARMSRAAFAQSFPRREEFIRFVDPAFSSSLWRRLG